MESQKPIYLDYNATTPLTPEVIAAMRPFLEEHFGNPSSSHPYGRRAHQAVEKARSQVAALIGAAPDEVYFTSGGTEANNLAIRGILKAHAPRGGHIITSAIEHPAVTEVCYYLAAQGYKITTLPVDEYGRVSPEDLKKALRSETVLVSVMHANNEVGTLQPIKTLATLAHQSNIYFHTDAAQSPGKIPVDVDDLGVDLLSIAGHKFYAPKGVGALFVRRGTVLEKILFGAGQERNLRPGTENVLEIVGLGQAAEQAQQDLSENNSHFQVLRDRLQSRLEMALPSGMIHVNGHPDERLPNTLSVAFKNIEADKLLATINNEVAASAGSACHADRVEISSVLQAMHVPVEWAKGTVRLSVGRMTNEAQIDQAVGVITRAINDII